MASSTFSPSRTFGLQKGLTIGNVWLPVGLSLASSTFSPSRTFGLQKGLTFGNVWLPFSFHWPQFGLQHVFTVQNVCLISNESSGSHWPPFGLQDVWPACCPIRLPLAPATCWPCESAGFSQGMGTSIIQPRNEVWECSCFDELHTFCVQTYTPLTALRLVHECTNLPGMRAVIYTYVFFSYRY